MKSKQTWTAPKLTTYGSVEQITEQTTTVNKVPGSGDTITITVVGIGEVANIAAAGSLESVTFTP